MTRRIFLFLEDEQHRIDRFRAVLGDVEMHIWSSAFAMADEIESHLPNAAMISLDHDLYPPDGCDDDWGDGTTVTSRLAELSPACPVIVHSSNVDGARRMVGQLEVAGWIARRVAPIGDDWIEVDWIAVMRELIRD